MAASPPVTAAPARASGVRAVLRTPMSTGLRRRRWWPVPGARRTLGMRRHTIDLDTTPHGRPGPVGESLACAHLERDDGLDVVLRNWTWRSGEVRGELDLIALDHGRRTLVVVEVKCRRSREQGGPLVAVTGRKQRRIRQLTGLLLREQSLPHRTVRFDVVGVLLPHTGHGLLEHVPGAF